MQSARKLYKRLGNIVNSAAIELWGAKDIRGTIYTGLKTIHKHRSSMRTIRKQAVVLHKNSERKRRIRASSSTQASCELLREIAMKLGQFEGSHLAKEH